MYYTGSKRSSAHRCLATVRRDAGGAVSIADRPAFRAAAAAGAVTAETPVFDPTITSVGAWRREFEKPAGASWHARLLPQVG